MTATFCAKSTAGSPRPHFFDHDKRLANDRHAVKDYFPIFSLRQAAKPIFTATLLNSVITAAQLSRSAMQNEAKTCFVRFATSVLSTDGLMMRVTPKQEARRLLAKRRK